MHALAIWVGDEKIDGMDARAVCLVARAGVKDLEMENDPVLENDRFFQEARITGQRNHTQQPVGRPGAGDDTVDFWRRGGWGRRLRRRRRIRWWRRRSWLARVSGRGLRRRRRGGGQRRGGGAVFGHARPPAVGV